MHPLISAFNSEALVKIAHDMRNHLEPEEKTLVLKEITLIARELKAWLSEQELSCIKLCPRESLKFTHQELINSVIKEYEISMEGHHISDIWRRAERQIPLSTIKVKSSFYFKLCNGARIKVAGYETLDIDDHPCEPTNFARLCILELWKQLT
jgi:hypothetical protein